MSIVGIYKITSPSGKVYIGQSWNIMNRFKTYKKMNCKGQRALYNSFSKYGVNEHKFETIHTLPSDINQNIIDEYEVFYIHLYKTSGFELINLKAGGKGGKHSEESRLKMSISSVGKQTWLGKKHTEETKNKIRNFRKGSKLSDRHIDILKKVNSGNKHSLGFKHTIETRNKLSRPVIKLDLLGNYIRKYNSAVQAAEEHGIVYTGIHNVASGYRKTAAGFKWKYA